MNYNKKIRDIKKIITDERYHCIGFCVSNDGSVVYSVSGDEKNEEKNLDLYQKNVENILSPCTHAKISSSFTLINSFSRRESFVKEYEKYFYSNLNLKKISKILFFDYPRYIKYSSSRNSKNNFNCVERKLIGYCNDISKIYVTKRPCYLCLIALPCCAETSYLEDKSLLVNTLTRCCCSIFKIK